MQPDRSCVARFDYFKILLGLGLRARYQQNLFWKAMVVIVLSRVNADYKVL